MLRETDRFDTKTKTGEIFRLVELRRVLVDTFGGKKTERLGTTEWQVVGDPSKAVSAVPGDDDEFIILPDDLRVRRIR